MDSPSRQTNREDNLNDSWVELHFQQQQNQQQLLTGSTGSGVRSGFATPEIKPHAAITSGQMEKLLLEAQRESRGSSRYSSQPGSSRGSPKSPHSPNNEVNPSALTDIQPIQEGEVLRAVVQKADIPTDWIWDWSSRPEAQPQHSNGSDSSRGSGVYRHPAPKRSRLSVRNSPVMRGGGGLLDNLNTLLISHACSFIIGAAAMFLYLKKYCNWTGPSIVTTPMD